MASSLLDKGETGFKPFVEIKVIRDSNVYRLESDNEAQLLHGLGLIEAGQRDDSNVDIGAGFSMALETSAQRLELDAHIERQTYSEFSSLDHTGGDARLLWKWQPSDNWNGRIRASFESKRRSFDNRLVTQEDIREKRRIGVESRFLHTSSIRSSVSVDLIDTSFHEEKSLDKQRVIVAASVHKLGQRDGNYYGGEVRAIQAEFDNTPSADYKQLEASAVASWHVSEQVHVGARLGWTKRDLDDNALRDDFNGPTGNVTAKWNSRDERLSLEAKAYRRLSSLSDEIADYAKLSGLRIGSSIAVAARTKVNTYIAYEQHNFSGNLSQRKDKVLDVGIEGVWNIYGNTDLTLGYQHLEKNSNLNAAEYDTDIVSLGVKLAF